VANRRNPPRLTERFELKLPAQLPAAITSAAERKFTTDCEYVRQAIVTALRADGIDPSLPKKAA
jgi:hypothetical protein